jgi:acetyl-CoA carboxylase biotin carboxylase subunit
MIRKLLIANRGEIAVRIVHACREMGIESIAVFSEADESAAHVEAADEAIAIGPPQAAESYLSIPKIIGAAKRTGADAVHPGYGFLSENAEFARACRDASLVFVGPPADVIARMGSKIEARRLMQEAGVPIVPGETPANQTDDGIKAAIGRVGLPVLIKASAGGGGKGMRQVDGAAEIDEAIQSARREATAAFGDGTLYVERLVRNARHVEVQIFADEHGNVMHLFERECSTQRRHQKVIEESPSPALTLAMRKKMTSAAVEAVRRTGYRNAGTIEFLLEGHGDTASFYFLEMNTRLQVEHPLTELVTGVDLVRAQILVASGEPLPWKQEDLSQRGHAIECRIYAEDPAQGFLPQAGRLLCYREPRMPGVRIDAGVREGGEVSVYYDPMLAKLIAYGETREAARARAIAALREYPILGIRTNIAFLVQILAHERFIKAAVDTSFLDAEGGALARAAAAVPDAAMAAAAACATAGMHGSDAAGGILAAGEAAADPWSQLQGWRG